MTHPSARDLLPQSGNLLVNERLGKAQRRIAHVQEKIAVRVDLKSVDTLKPKPDGPRIRGGGDDEIVLETLLPRPVVHEVDSRVDRAIPNPRIGRRIDAPLAGITADERVGSAWELIEPLRIGIGIGAEEPHADDGATRDKHRIGGREK